MGKAVSISDAGETEYPYAKEINWTPILHVSQK